MKKHRVFLILGTALLFFSCQDPVGLGPAGSEATGRDISGGLPTVNYNDDFNQVRLAYGLPFYYAVSGMSQSDSDYYVHVKNLGTPASRHVRIHYTTNGATWQDLELALQGTYTNHSLYYGRLVPNTTRFAVQYQTDAGTWWDNNRGADYWIQPWTTSGNYKPGAVGGGIALLNAKTVKVTFGGGSYGWKVQGQMAVDTSIIPVPQGGIHIKETINGVVYWRDFPHFNLAYTMTSGSNISVYNFESDPIDQSSNFPPPLSSNLEFVLYGYKNTGSPLTCYIYWDNNFDANYTLPKVDGSTIR